MIIPINMLAWLLGAIAFFVFGLKNSRRFRETGNELHREFAHFFIALSISLTAFALPSILFRNNIELVIILMSIADGLLIMSMVLLAKVAARAYAMPRGALRTIQSALLIIALGVTVTGITSTTIQVDTYTYSHIVASYNGVLQAIGLTAITLPIGWLFFSKGIEQPKLYSKLKVGGIGVIFFAVCSVVAYNYIVLAGQATLVGSILNLVAFTALLMISLSPARLTERETSSLQENKLRTRSE